MISIFLTSIIRCIVGSNDTTAPATEEKISEKPNVLFICVDDLRPELGCYGADYIKSPNIDRVAAGGYVFTNHFAQVPTSGASRFYLLTGMFPKTTGHLGNEACREYISGRPETEAPETFIHHLRRNGYYTVGIGKISHYVDGLLYGYTDPVGKEYELPHGWHLGDQLVWGKHTIFERALKSALVIKIPGEKGGAKIKQVVSTVDIYPTIVDLCGLKMPMKTDGKSLLPLLNSSADQWENASYGYYMNGISLCTERYRLTRYFRKEEPVIELYDHKTDPYETTNITAENPLIVTGLMPLWEKGNTGLFEK